MKKLFTLLLTLIMTICLVNINVKSTKADNADGGPLYFGNGTSGWKLYTNVGLTSVYDGPNWSASANTLTLSDGFSYTSNGQYTIKFMNDADTTLNINGTVTLGNNAPYNEGVGNSVIEFYKNHNHTITKGDNAATLNINVSNSKAICLNATMGDRTGTMNFENINININGKCDYAPLIDIYDVKFVNTTMIAKNKGSNLAMNCHLGNVDEFKDNESEIILEGNEENYGAILMLVATGDTPKKAKTFNDTYYALIENEDGNACKGYLATFTPYVTENPYYFVELNGDGNGYPASKKVRLVKPTDENKNDLPVTMEYNGADSAWKLTYEGGSEFKGENVTWKVSGDENNPTLELLDGFMFVTSAPTALQVKPNNKNINLTVKVSGDASIVSTYNGDKKHYAFRAVDGTSRFVKKVIFEGDGKSTLNIVSGTSSYIDPSHPTYTAVAGMYFGKADLTFKNGKFNFVSRDHKVDMGVTSAICAEEMSKLTLDNAILCLRGGETATTLEGTPDINIGIALATTQNSKLNISLSNDSKLLMVGTMSTVYLPSTAKLLINYDDAIYYAGMLKDKDEIVKGKFGTFTFTLPGPTQVSFNSFIHTYNSNDYTCFRAEFISKTGSDPSPSKKDESCEKVIGPTWHWNNDKGVCEEVGVVGTFTR